MRPVVFSERRSKLVGPQEGILVASYSLTHSQAWRMHRWLEFSIRCHLFISLIIIPVLFAGVVRISLRESKRNLLFDVDSRQVHRAETKAGGPCFLN